MAIKKIVAFSFTVYVRPINSSGIKARQYVTKSIIIGYMDKCVCVSLKPKVLDYIMVINRVWVVMMNSQTDELCHSPVAEQGMQEPNNSEWTH